MQLWAEALLLGLFSGLSLPVGAWLGDRMSPVRTDLVAGLMAFGAGALLFAVTVELYGAALHEVEAEKGKWGGATVAICVTIGCAIIGALVYLHLNKLLEVYMAAPAADEPLSPVSPSSTSQAHETTPLTNEASQRARSSWRRAGRQVRTAAKIAEPMKAGRAKALVLHTATKDDEKEGGTGAAWAMWLGVLVDGIPEGILLGFLAAQHRLSMVLVLSLFIANAPEAFAAASFMKTAGVPRTTTIGIWALLCVITGCLCGLSCYLLLWLAPGGHIAPEIEYGVAAVEGVAGGAMIACIAAVMLPEAFERSNKDVLYLSSGFLCTTGFLVAVLLKVLGGTLDPDEAGQAVEGAKHAAQVNMTQLISFLGPHI